MRFAKINIFFVLIPLISACDSSLPAKYGYGEPNGRYGSAARLSAQENYLNKLSTDDYISQKESWDAKLATRKQQFNDTLKREYLELSTNLSKDKNYTDSTYFRRKALDAEKGDFDIMPEDPTRWIVESDTEMEDLRAARLKLLDSLVGYTPVVDPLSSSKALVSYDCWVQQAQSLSLKLKQNNCKQQFMSNYAKLEKISKDVEDKDFAAISEKYNWVNIDKSVYDKRLRPELVEAQKIAAREAANNQSNDLYRVEYTSPKVSSLKQASKTAATKPAATAAKATTVTTTTKVETKPSMAYTPGEKVAVPQKTVTTQTVTKAVVPTPAAPPAPPVVGPLPKSMASAAVDKSLITDQTDKSPDLVYMVYFDGRADQLSDKAKAELDKAADDIKKNSPKLVSVNGHTDRSFDSGESLITSKKRADAARDYLVSKGIGKEIIRTYGFGKTDNIIDNPEGEVRPANNRTEIVFKGSAQ